MKKNSYALQTSRKSGLKTLLTTVMVVALLLGLTITAGAEPATDAYPFAVPSMDRHPFAEGSTRVTLFFGHGESFNNTYTIYGLGFGYYLQDGLEVGIDTETWTGAAPRIVRVSPGVRYVFPVDIYWRPYAGIFYRRAFIENFEDIDAVGARAGFNMMMGKRLYVGAGIVHEFTLRCDSSTNLCTDTYLEAALAVTF